MKNIAFIPARGGSKGLPNKNILSFCGKPLIEWSIRQALESKNVDRVFVSTDSKEIAELALAAGAEVPFMRPENISRDTSTTESAMLHFLNWAREQNLTFDNIILLQATSPIRSHGRIDDALEYFENSGKESLVSVAESHRFTWRMSFEPLADYPVFSRPRRQDIKDDERKFIETGSIYVTKVDKFLEYENRLTKSVCMYKTSFEESYEIDDKLDFDICELIFKSYVLGGL